MLNGSDCIIPTVILFFLLILLLKAREAKIQQEWTVKVAKIGEASRKKDEFNSSFINSTKEQLESKMETVVEKREALISDKKEKLKVGFVPTTVYSVECSSYDDYNWNGCLVQTQLQEIEKTRTQLEKQRDEEREAIEEKLRVAAQKRDENIKNKLDRLKEHVSVGKIHSIAHSVNCNAAPLS